MQNEIVINAQPGETRVAILERGNFVDLHIERDSGRSTVGRIIKGIVTRVLPGMQAAFVDVGMEKAGFLYAGDYLDHDEVNGDDDAPSPRRRRSRNGNGRQPPPRIDTLLHEGQEIVVQVGKEPIGTKGARITSHISIPGRHLVLTPGDRVGVSRRIDTDRERRRLREIVERLRPRDLGFIIRTAGGGATEADLAADVKYLTTVWDDIQIRKEEVKAPAVLYEEPSLPVRMLRDFTTAETKRVTVDSREVYDRLVDFTGRFMAEPRPRLDHYTGAEPIFDHYGLEEQVDANLGRKVWLKSGGHLVMDQSEALTAIDVNTGRYVGKHDLEETVLKTNLEAVKEIVHQLRFRNIGGLIIVDLIDMESGSNREKVYRAFQEALRQDKAKTNILKISELGLVEMTRKRTRENLVQQVCEPCAYCDGRGYVLSRESVSFKVLREVRKDVPRFRGRRIAVTVNPAVASEILGAGAQSLEQLGRELGREVEVRARPHMHQEQFEVTALDEGPEVRLEIGWLSAGPARAEPPGPETAAEASAETGAGRTAEAEEAPAASSEAAGVTEVATDPPAEAVEERAADALEPEAESGPEAAGASGGDGRAREAGTGDEPAAGRVDDTEESRILRAPEDREDA